MADVAQQARVSLSRIVPRLATRFAKHSESDAWHAFIVRLEIHFSDLFQALLELYGDQYDFFYHLEEIVAAAADSWLARPTELQRLDVLREQTPHWFLSEEMVGAVCYVDLFAGTLEGLASRIPYLIELGVTYLHLMPLFKAPEGDSDGGYAVSSYREVAPSLGSMQELASLAAVLRGHGISLVLDFIFNHTSDEHLWARNALAGDQEYRDYYFIFPDRRLPDLYQQQLRDIFPEHRAGSFTFRQDIGQWVWTTFNSFQWDLNYANPAVFRRMGQEMLFLANHGAEVLRLDAVAFAWKQLGTTCENLPQVHLLVQAFNALARIAAPSLLFKSEAIVHPHDVSRYVNLRECQISYNPLLMALLWEALATREVRLLQLSMQEWFSTEPGCAWVNYVRSHDDIGWTFADSDAARLGIDAFGHRRFLNDFYTGRFPGSFASGLPFQENLQTGDARISGSCASLAGLERALLEGDERLVTLAVSRILLLYGVVCAIGGIPLLYLGDELGSCNDYSYLTDPAKASDNRWVHRPRFDWQFARLRHDPHSVSEQIFGGLTRLIRLRKRSPVFAGGAMDVVDFGNGSVFSFLRQRGELRLLVLANFSERTQSLSGDEVRRHSLGARFTDLISGSILADEGDIQLPPYALQWLVASLPE